MGIAAQESRLNYIHQLGKGVAKGLWQVEPATYADYARFLDRNFSLKHRILDFLGYEMLPPVDRVLSDVSLAAIMCRVHFLRFTKPLPDANDKEALAKYWKVYYNTYLGSGTVKQFLRNYKLVDPAL